MEFRSGDIRTPRIVEEVAIHGDHAVELLGEVTEPNKDFQLVPFPCELRPASRSCIAVPPTACTVFVDRGIGMAFSGIGPVV